MSKEEKVQVVVHGDRLNVTKLAPELSVGLLGQAVRLHSGQRIILWVKIAFYYSTLS